VRAAHVGTQHQPALRHGGAGEVKPADPLPYGTPAWRDFQAPDFDQLGGIVEEMVHLVDVAPLCAICERELPRRKAGAGRPPQFCGSPYRRARQFEVRRIQHRLARLEHEQERARRNPVLLDNIDQINSEIRRNRDRLLILLD